MTDKENIIRFRKLTSSCTTKKGNQYLLPPDAKDARWGIQVFGGVYPITDNRADRVLDKMEKIHGFFPEQEQDK